MHNTIPSPLENQDIIVIHSGGLDSTTLVYDLHAMGWNVECLSFNYGQKHKKELFFAQRTASKLGLRWNLIDLYAAGLPALIATADNSLVGGSEVPEGHYAAESMSQTVVPNRNMLMLSLAAAVAVARGAGAVATGVHAGDHFIYPDCRPEFISLAGCAVHTGNEGFGKWDSRIGPIFAPYVFQTKTDIAERALWLGVPLQDTWSCYKGGDMHCGRCGTCVERLEAIDEARTRIINKGGPLAAKAVDLTRYEDTTFWRRAISDEGDVEPETLNDTDEDGIEAETL